MWCTAMTERLKDRLEDDKPVELSDVIERFQQQVVLHENDRYSKAPQSHASFATFRGDSQSSGPKPKCPCGYEHWPDFCFYINREKKRPTWWKHNEDIQKKIDKMLKEDAEFKASAERSLKRWKEKKTKEEKEKKGASPAPAPTSSHVTCALTHNVAFTNAAEGVLYRV